MCLHSTVSILEKCMAAPTIVKHYSLFLISFNQSLSSSAALSLACSSSASSKEALVAELVLRMGRPGLKIKWQKICAKEKLTTASLFSFEPLATSLGYLALLSVQVASSEVTIVVFCRDFENANTQMAEGEENVKGNSCLTAGLY